MSILRFPDIFNLHNMILFTYLLLISALSLLPAGTLHLNEAALFPHADKVVHFGMYAVLTFLLFYTWPGKFQGRYRQFIPLIAVIVWGTAMEYLQGLGDYGRHFSYLDIIANTLGFFPGWLLWKWFFEGRYRNRLRSIRQAS
jgi:VanZ family protein